MLDPAHPKQRHALERLRSEVIIWLSSVRPDGRAHLVPVWFLWEEGKILIFSQPENQKIRNLRNNPSVMLALEAKDRGEDIVLMEGTASLLDGSDPNAPSAAMPAYARKYAPLLKRMNWTASDMAASYTQAILVTVRRFVAY